MSRDLFIPVILGTTREGRMSERVSRFVVSQLGLLPGVETELVDIRLLPVGSTGAWEDLKIPSFSALCNRSDAFVIIAPEYNHGYPGLLKHLLDTNLKEYIHKAVGIVGVSSGPFGGTRVIQNLLPVMRELGLVTIFWDGNFPQVHKTFDENGNLNDSAYVRRLEKFFKELIWMGTVLRYGRENVALT